MRSGAMEACRKFEIQGGLDASELHRLGSRQGPEVKPRTELANAYAELA